MSRHAAGDRLRGRNPRAWLMGHAGHTLYLKLTLAGGFVNLSHSQTDQYVVRLLRGMIADSLVDTERSCRLRGTQPGEDATNAPARLTPSRNPRRLATRAARQEPRAACNLHTVRPMEREATRQVEDRLRGALVGLAVGDALGAAVEFMPPGTFEPVASYRGGGPHGLAPGQWTDDTSMALALADSLAQVGWDLNDQAARYVRWWKEGAYSVIGRCFDIGTTTQAALERYIEHGDARRSGDPGERASGNGSIMRLAPVAIRFRHLFPDQLDELARRAAESSLPTHASAACLSACRYLAVVLAGLASGVDRFEVLAPDWQALTLLRQCEPLHPAVDEVAAGSFRRRQPPQIVGSGYVVRSLEAALWAFHQAGSFEEAVLMAVNLGDDADTTGAVCGQLAGACWGESGIPREWRDGLARREMIETALRGNMA